MKIEVSVGELVDKVTILEIKVEKINDRSKLENISKEYKLLKTALKGMSITTDSQDFKRLKQVNLRLWKIEDDIRLKEFQQEFDQEFIKLARAVYFENDSRAAIKQEINLKYNSELKEEKQYVDYK